MSRLRNRNIRTKIHAVAKWGHSLQASGKLFVNGGTTTTADSGIAEITPPAQKLNGLRVRRGKWNADATLDLVQNDPEKEFDEIDDDGADSSEEESRHSCSSVDTLKVLDEIRNLEDSVKTMSAESYNSWAEEYELDNTQAVKQEFQRMERVLQCREPIPPHYDKEEYKLWIKTFPLLGLVSRTPALDFHKQTTPRANSHIAASKFCDTSPIVLLPLTPTPMNQDGSTGRHSTEQLDSFSSYPALNQVPTHSTTTYSNQSLAVNNTINPRTIRITSDHGFLQLAPLNISASHRRQSGKLSNINSGNMSLRGRKSIIPPTREKSNSLGHASGSTAEWMKDVHHFGGMQRQRHHLYTPEKSEKHPRRKSSRSDPLKSSSEFIVLPPIADKEFRSASAATISSSGKVPTLPLGRLKHPPVHPLYENDKEGDHNDGFVSYRHRKRKYK